jgi:hypothetical protein
VLVRSATIGEFDGHAVPLMAGLIFRWVRTPPRPDGVSLAARHNYFLCLPLIEGTRCKKARR